MKWILMLTACTFFGATHIAWADDLKWSDEVEYELAWEYRGIPIRFQVFEAPRSWFKRVSETGLISSTKELEIIRPLPDQKIRLRSKDTAYLILFAENSTQKEVSFAVAPHSSHPVVASLGFDFKCLCNGHVYTIPPGNKWYRVMALKTLEKQVGGKARLQHIVFAAKAARTTKPTKQGHGDH